MKNKQLFIIIILSLLAAGMMAVATIPQWREMAKSFLAGNQTERKILAKAQGKLAAGLEPMTFIKILQEQNIFVEVYTQNETEGQQLVQKLELPYSRDAYLSFATSSTNLALVDVDKDGVLEVLVPCYDDEMVARLNVFKYDHTSRTFSLVESEN